jgi:hypothetical protein
MIWLLTHPLPPLLSELDRRTKRERQLAAWTRSQVMDDGEKALSSINHSILSGWDVVLEVLIFHHRSQETKITFRFCHLFTYNVADFFANQQNYLARGCSKRGMYRSMPILIVSGNYQYYQKCTVTNHLTDIGRGSVLAVTVNLWIYGRECRTQHSLILSLRKSVR